MGDEVAQGPVFKAPKPAGAFPNKTDAKLTLRRRSSAYASLHSPTTLAEVSSVTQRQIAAVAALTRSPFGNTPEKDYQAKFIELQQTMQALEKRLQEREAELEETLLRLAERERDLAEDEALLEARSKLLAASRRSRSPFAMVTVEEQSALQQLKQALDQQETSLNEARVALREREKFLDESETRLFEKVQEHQEKESELEQREEEIKRRETQFQIERPKSPADVDPDV